MLKGKSRLDLVNMFVTGELTESWQKDVCRRECWLNTLQAISVSCIGGALQLRIHDPEQCVELSGMDSILTNLRKSFHNWSFTPILGWQTIIDSPDRFMRSLLMFWEKDMSLPEGMFKSYAVRQAWYYHHRSGLRLVYDLFDRMLKARDDPLKVKKAIFLIKCLYENPWILYAKEFIAWNNELVYKLLVDTNDSTILMGRLLIVWQPLLRARSLESNAFYGIPLLRARSLESNAFYGIPLLRARSLESNAFYGIPLDLDTSIHCYIPVSPTIWTRLNKQLWSQSMTCQME